jgi:hypothetical protein
MRNIDINDILGESANKESEVTEDFQSPTIVLKEWYNIIKALIKWSMMEDGPERDKLLDAIERESFAKAKDRRGFDEFDLEEEEN